ncbi:isocitrate lyase/phosphoenolpyruvate mutase family protein [Streptomyces sp. NPDC004542]|uniref:isocitrate lyase/phosphoenolpyruvate mutase family protein n=1 Tax=Streptomyces sp. NPDC004542 TaxID=3154281 RepID=UPI0033BCDF67
MTHRTSRCDRALAFRSLRVPGRPLVLPGAWDAAGTGPAWALGAVDGGRLRRDLAPEALARVAAAVRVPVGVSLEDARYEPGRAPLREAADAEGVPLFVWSSTPASTPSCAATGTRPATLERAAAFRAAGAGGVFVPGAVEPETVEALLDAVDGPLDVLVGPGAPAVAEPAALGVARVSAGSGVAQAAYAVGRRAARELLDADTCGAPAGGLGYGELDALLAPDC